MCLRTQAVSIEAWFRPKGRAIGIKEKPENFNTIILSYEKKLWGGQIEPPPPQQE